LPNENEAGDLKPAPVAGLHRLGTDDDAPGAQAGAEKSDRMTAQGQPGIKQLI
jgi:hypothetical protein